MQLKILLRYGADRYKAQQMCDKAILESDGTLQSVPDCHESEEMSNKAVDNYPQA